MVQKIRVAVDSGANQRISIHRSYELSPELLLDFREYRVELPVGEQRYQQCKISDQQNWICDQFSATQLEMRAGQLYIAGIPLDKNTSWLSGTVQN